MTTPARSPYRDRPVEESLDLFARMKNGEFPDGKMTLRAKIDLNSGNFNMRAPVIYRINHAHHHNTGDEWCIYPMYDFTHPIEDALEDITHSLCTLEFEAHRPLYDWVANNISITAKPRQIEFARLNITNTVMSKRQAAQTGGRKLRRRLGRSPYAHHLRTSPPRLYPSLHPKFLRPYWCFQSGKRCGLSLSQLLLIFLDE